MNEMTRFFKDIRRQVNLILLLSHCSTSLFAFLPNAPSELIASPIAVCNLSSVFMVMSRLVESSCRSCNLLSFFSPFSSASMPALSISATITFLYFFALPYLDALLCKIHVVFGARAIGAYNKKCPACHMRLVECLVFSDACFTKKVGVRFQLRQHPPGVKSEQ